MLVAGAAVKKARQRAQLRGGLSGMAMPSPSSPFMNDSFVSSCTGPCLHVTVQASACICRWHVHSGRPDSSAKAIGCCIHLGLFFTLRFDAYFCYASPLQTASFKWQAAT